MEFYLKVKIVISFPLVKVYYPSAGYPGSPSVVGIILVSFVVSFIDLISTGTYTVV